METSRGPAVPQVSDKVAEQARTFLLGLFMSLRTAQIHDTSNKAFEKALLSVHQTADDLFKATGAFRVQFVDEAVFINGARIRLERSAYTSIRALKAYLEEQEIGGISMSGPPSYDAIKNLVLGLASKDHEQRATALDYADLQLLGIQALADEVGQEVKIDRRVLAVQSYGKLILAMREQLEHAEGGGTELPNNRIRAVRVIQDLVELASERADFIIRLATNQSGTAPDELHGVNVTLMCIALGTALGLPRRDLVDIGITAMFHHVALRRHRYDGRFRLGRDVTLASVGHLMYQSGAGGPADHRTVILAEHRTRDRDLTGVRKSRPHVGARILGLITAYEQLVSGFGTRNEMAAHPLEVLRALVDDAGGRFDPNLVDLLMNVMRAYPEDTEVVLDDGRHATVQSHLGSSRWDRPVVAIIGTQETVDLMRKSDDRFVGRIRGTPRFCGRISRRVDAGRPSEPNIPSPPTLEDSATTPAPPTPTSRGSVDDVLRDFLSAEGDE